MSSEWRDFRRARTKRARVLFRRVRGTIPRKGEGEEEGEGRGSWSRGLVPRPSRVEPSRAGSLFRLCERSTPALLPARRNSEFGSPTDARRCLFAPSSLDQHFNGRIIEMNRGSPRYAPRLFVAERPISWLPAFPLSPERE